MGGRTQGSPDGLTDRQRIFVDEYLVDLNARAAYIRAGYAPKRAKENAHITLNKPAVQKAISAAFRRLQRRTEVTVDRVVNELKGIAFSDMRDLMQWDGNGVQLKASGDLGVEHAAAVAEVAETLSKDGDRAVRLKMHDKLKALELIGRHIGMWPSRMALTDPSGNQPPTVRLDVLDDRLAAIFGAAAERAKQEG